MVPLFELFSGRKPTIEEQLETLIRLGIPPNEHFSLDDAIAAFGRQAYEKKPYILFLVYLEEKPRKSRFSQDPITSGTWTQNALRIMAPMSASLSECRYLQEVSFLCGTLRISSMWKTNGLRSPSH